LEFSLAASAILIATGAVGFALAFDSGSPTTSPHEAAPTVGVAPPVLGHETA